MSSIQGLPHNVSLDDLEADIALGGRFVVYHTALSVIILSFRIPSDLYYIPAGQNRVTKGLIWTMLSLVVGWWGFPFGPIYTIWTVIENLTGGKDVTDEVMLEMRQSVKDQAFWQDLRDPSRRSSDPYSEDY